MGGDLGSIGVAEARSALALVARGRRRRRRPGRAARLARSPAPRQPTGASRRPQLAEPSAETLPSFQHWLASSAQLPLASAAARADPAARSGRSRGHAAFGISGTRRCHRGSADRGDAWQLMDRMLAAIEVSEEQPTVPRSSCFHSPGARDRRGARGLRRAGAAACRAREAQTPAPARRRARHAPSRQAARCSSRPGSQDRRRSHRSHLPSALFD